MQWFLPIIEVWKDMHDDPKPWVICAAAFAISLIALVGLSASVSSASLAIAFCCAVGARFFSADTSIGRRFFLAALSVIAWFLFTTVVLVLSWPEF